MAIVLEIQCCALKELSFQMLVTYGYPLSIQATVYLANSPLLTSSGEINLCMWRWCRRRKTLWEEKD